MSEEHGTFEVVINPQGQYSLWPAGKAMAIGWKPVGQCGDRQACLDYINQHWTDMRPLSVV